MGEIKSEYNKARKRVKAKKEFYQHLTSYVVMGIFFFLLNAVTSFGIWWFYWPLLGWGIGLAFHYFDVFGFPGTSSPDWEEKAIAAELERMRPRPKTEEPAEQMELRELQKERTERRPRWDDSELV
jgi:hypothetical protein